ncbi:unnamed protein product, partial [Chrysoparadoxa australica]
VRREDQERINEFGNLTTGLRELRQDLKATQDTLDELDDATTELMTGEGEDVKLMLGDCFVMKDEDYATAYCEKKQEQVQESVTAAQEKERKILARQEELKK